MYPSTPPPGHIEVESSQAYCENEGRFDLRPLLVPIRRQNMRSRPGASLAIQDHGGDENLNLCDEPCPRKRVPYPKVSVRANRRREEEGVKKKKGEKSEKFGERRGEFIGVWAGLCESTNRSQVRGVTRVSRGSPLCFGPGWPGA